MTRTDKTNADYYHRVTSFKARCAHESGMATVSWESAVTALIASKPAYKAASWNLAKWAFIAVMEEERSLGTDDDDLCVAIDLMRDEKPTGALKDSSRTSAVKAKRMSSVDREKIFAALVRSRSPLAAALIHFIRASCAAGLRPSEWRHAILAQPEDGVQMKLVVRNGKNTNARSHGAYRTLRWSKISPSTKNSVAFVVEMAKSCPTDEDFGRILKALQKILHDIDRRLWPKRKFHYALYSCRHAFAAAAKSKYGPAEVAAMMGHGSDDTASVHYGRQKRGGAQTDAPVICDLDLPEPDPQEVVRVRPVRQKKRDRLAALSARPVEPLMAHDATETNSQIEDLLPGWIIDDFPVPTPRTRVVDQAGAAATAALVADFAERQSKNLDEIDEIVRRMRERGDTPFLNLDVEQP